TQPEHPAGLRRAGEGGGLGRFRRWAEHHERRRHDDRDLERRVDQHRVAPAKDRDRALERGGPDRAGEIDARGNQRHRAAAPPVKLRPRPFIASVACIRRHSCPALIRRQLQNAPPRAASGRIARYMTGRTAFYSSWPGLTRPSTRENPWIPGSSPGMTDWSWSTLSTSLSSMRRL